MYPLSTVVQGARRLKAAWRTDTITSEELGSCFFFQAEDGIRDLTVTGVQTCALPILLLLMDVYPLAREAARGDRRPSAEARAAAAPPRPSTRVPSHRSPRTPRATAAVEIGRASCRERV